MERLAPRHAFRREMDALEWSDDDAAFAASQVLGLPAGMYLGARWGWHSSFLMIVVVSALAGVVIFGGTLPMTLTAGAAWRTDPAARDRRGWVAFGRIGRAF